MSVSDFGTYDSSEEAVVMISSSGAVTYWNRAAESLFGFESKDITGRSFEALAVPPNFKRDYQEQINRAGSQGHASDRSMRKHKSRGLVFVESTYRNQQSENGAGILCLMKDISGILLAREANSVETRFGDLLDALPDAIVIVDAMGKIVFSNRQVQPLFGYGKDELRGRELEILIPARFKENHETHRAAYFEAPRIRKMGEGPALFGLRKGGGEFPVEISLGYFELEHGNVVAVSSIRDISSRRT